MLLYKINGKKGRFKIYLTPDDCSTGMYLVDFEKTKAKDSITSNEISAIEKEWPRYYFNINFAKSEVIAWMICNEHHHSKSTWQKISAKKRLEEEKLKQHAALV